MFLKPSLDINSGSTELSEQFVSTFHCQEKEAYRHFCCVVEGARPLKKQVVYVRNLGYNTAAFTLEK